MPVLGNGASYKNPCKLGDQLEFRTWVDEWARRTFLMKHEITHSDGRPALTGFDRRALIVTAPETEKGMKAVEIPDDIQQRFVD